jgi:tetratricopeptide (TPR) repeat protein
LAEALQRRRGIELAGAIARHYEAAGHDEAAAEHHVRAGDHARGLYANSDAIAHYRSALALGHPDGARLHAAIGDLLMLLGDYAGALAGYETAAAHGDAGALQEVEHKLGRLHHRRGDWERSEAHLEAALALLPVEASAQRARILADRALTARYRGDDKSASSLATEALDWATRADDAAALAQAHNMLGILMTGSGGYASAREHLERSVALAQTLPEDDASVAALNNLALLVAETGDPRRAVELGERALELCSAQGDLHREAALHNNLADFLRAAGDHDAAMVHLKRSAALFAEVGEEPATQPAIWKLVEWN